MFSLLIHLKLHPKQCIITQLTNAHGLAATTLSRQAVGVDLNAPVVGATDVVLAHILLALAAHAAQLVGLVAVGAIVRAHGHGTWHACWNYQ